MRIIRGTHRGKTIQAPKNLPVRPTTDFAKEGLFNILENLTDLRQAEVLDLFAGTGSITWEFASRGCLSVITVELNHHCYAFLKQTCTALGFQNVRVIRADVFTFIRHCNEAFDIIFADPPYALSKAWMLPGFIVKSGLLKPDGLFILEHPSTQHFESTEGFIQHRKYGDVNFSFFRKPPIAEA